LSSRWELFVFQKRKNQLHFYHIYPAREKISELSW